MRKLLRTGFGHASRGRQENDVVFINGGVRDFELARRLEHRFGEKSAHSHCLVEQRSHGRKYYEEVSEK